MNYSVWDESSWIVLAYVLSLRGFGNSFMSILTFYRLNLLRSISFSSLRRVLSFPVTFLDHVPARQLKRTQETLPIYKI